MSNLQDPSVSLGCIDQGLTVLHARGERFLHQNVYPVLKKLHANPGVIGRGRSQADSIYLAEYLAKIRERPPTVGLRDLICPTRQSVNHCSQFNAFQFTVEARVLSP
jgi:hypothetical protein